MINEVPWAIPFNFRHLLHKLDITDGKVHNFNIEYYKNYFNKYAVTPKILIVGQNPSDDSPNNSAFQKSTKSGKTVRSWFKDLDCALCFENTYNWKHKDYPKPNISTIILTGEIPNYHAAGWKIIAVGSFAQEVLKRHNIPFFAMPHPSGLCRFWNDKTVAESKIKEMIGWVKNGTQN